MNMRVKAAAFAFLAASVSAMADIKLNDNISLNGYAVGSYQLTSPSPGASSDTFQVDTALLGSTFTFKPVTGAVSVLYTPNTANEVTLLDANVTYDAGGGVSFTGGKFLSYLGYESFYPINMDQISYANGQFLGPIPGYHSGLRLDYSDAANSAGIAVLDSVYSPYNATKGDGELKNNQGFEAFYSYKGIKDVVLWAGLAYDTKGGFQPHDVLTLDFWASYQIDKAARIAAEYANKDGGPGAKGYNWLAFLDYSFNDKASCAFRVSGENMSDGGPSFTKYTICPGYALTANLTVRAEYSYTKYSGYSTVDNTTETTINHDSASFFGVQAVFKF